MQELCVLSRALYRKVRMLDYILISVMERLEYDFAVFQFLWSETCLRAERGYVVNYYICVCVLFVEM